MKTKTTRTSTRPRRREPSAMQREAFREAGRAVGAIVSSPSGWPEVAIHADRPEGDFGAAIAAELDEYNGSSDPYAVQEDARRRAAIERAMLIALCGPAAEAELTGGAIHFMDDDVERARLAADLLEPGAAHELLGLLLARARGILRQPLYRDITMKIVHSLLVRRKLTAREVETIFEAVFLEMPA